MTKAPRPKKCAGCGNVFQPERQLQKACGVECAYKVARINGGKKRAAQYRADKKRLKSRADWLKEAQAAVNRYVRLRDAGRPCISCDKPSSWQGQWHASHFRSVGAATAVRFNLWNIHKSCSICNNWKSGNLSEYEPRLREKIGDEKVDWIRSQNQCVTYSIEYLERVKRIFTKKASALAKRSELQ